MSEKVKIVVADPAGNVTIFVKTPYTRTAYQRVARKLLEMTELGGEQVAFIKDMTAGTGRMEMCGLEFCGNASRAFALLLAKSQGIKGEATVPVTVSGCEETLQVQVDTARDWTKIKMPLPSGCKPIEVPGSVWSGVEQADTRTGRLVDMGGIVHLIISGITPDLETFARIKAWLYTKMTPPAIGVMFWNETEEKLTPMVYVKDVDSTYVEGSCGSGTTACGYAFSQGKPDGVYHYHLPQPAGVIDATVEVAEHRVQAVYIEGTVMLEKETEVEL